MTLVMNSKITFPEHNGRREVVLRRIHSATIETSWKTLTDRATIELPRDIRFFENERELTRRDISKIFRIGDPVIIELGYGLDKYLVEEFRGYISAPVGADEYTVIKCDDEMYKLKSIPVNYSSSGTNLEDLLKAIVPGYQIEALSGVPLGGVRFSKTTVGKVLEKLQDDPWRLYSYMKGNTLVCGKVYSDDSDLDPVKFNMELNLMDNNLQYKKTEEVILKMTGTSVLVNGQKLDYTIGDDGGDVVNLTYYNIEVPAELERKVKADYEKRKAGGFDGTITAYGEPSVRHGMKADLTSNRYPDRNGTYYIDTVVKEFLEEPIYKQTITLGEKIA